MTPTGRRWGRNGTRARLASGGRECWEEIWDIIGPQIDYVMEGKGSTWNEDALVPVTRHGKLEQVYWTYSYGPIDLEGGVGGVLVVCTDVTDQHVARERLRGEFERLSNALRAGPRVHGDPAWPPACLRAHQCQLPPDDRRPAVHRQGGARRRSRCRGAGVLRTPRRRSGVAGEPYVGRQFPLTLNEDGGQRTVYVDFVYQPIFEADGTVSGVFVEGSDVTDHVNAQGHLRLINFELKHRVKNTLAMVSAIASQTLQSTVPDSAAGLLFADDWRHSAARTTF